MNSFRIIDTISGGEFAVTSYSVKRLRISNYVSDSWNGLFLWRRLSLLILQIFRKNFCACDLTCEPVRDCITSSTFFQSFPWIKTAKCFLKITFQELNMLLSVPSPLEKRFFGGFVSGSRRGRIFEILLHQAKI